MSVARAAGRVLRSGITPLGAVRTIAKTPARVARIKQGRRGFFRRAHFFLMGTAGDLLGVT